MMTVANLIVTDFVGLLAVAHGHANASLGVNLPNNVRTSPRYSERMCDLGGGPDRVRLPECILGK